MTLTLMGLEWFVTDGASRLSMQVNVFLSIPSTRPFYLRFCGGNYSKHADNSVNRYINLR